MKNNLIDVTKDYDLFAKNVVLGDLTARQYKLLEKIASSNLDYNFEVVRYAEYPKHRGSSATHVQLSKNGCVIGLVGRGTAQYYDNDQKAKQLVKQISSRIYRFTAVLHDWRPV